MINNAILAGIVIGLGGLINLHVGAPVGPFLFSVGLMSVLVFKMDLFTGKAGLLTLGEITPKKLLDIWGGNLMGACLIGALVTISQDNVAITAARKICEVRLANGFLVNCCLGIYCGLLMYIAVTGFQKTGSFIIAVFPVAAFILAGFNHCVADMFYVFVSGNFETWWELVSTTIGNIIGCNIIPLLKKARL